MSSKPEKLDLTIWYFAFGYFAAYAPYSALTKYLSKFQGIAGFELLPITGLASLVSMFVFLSAMRWWKHATHRKVFGFSIPVPGFWTFLSGLCTAAIIPTTTLAYTFGGISIVFMMLLMRGGVLVIAPIVDLISGRKVRWFSWVALALSIAALFTAFAGKGNKLDDGSGWLAMTAHTVVTNAVQLWSANPMALINLAIYLMAYFIRLQFMSRLAKSDDENARTRYFVEEQMVATPALAVTLLAVAFLGSGPSAEATARGFVDFWAHGLVVVAVALVVGVLSQFTGIFGGLILLDKRENTYCVPVNRASSILAGLVASYGLYFLVPGERSPADSELIGAGLIIAAIAALSLPPMFEKRAKARRAAAAAAAAIAALPQAPAASPESADAAKQRAS